MDILKQEILRKKQALTEESGGRKFFKRSEIEQKRIQKLREEEKLEAEAKRRRSTQTQSSTNPNKPTNPKSSSENDAVSSISKSDEQKIDDLILTKQEVIRRLRLLKQPVTLFGESDDDRLDRLKHVLKTGEFELDDSDMTEGQTNDFLRDIVELKKRQKSGISERKRKANNEESKEDKDEEEDGGGSGGDEEDGDGDGKRMKSDFRELCDEDKILVFFKKLLIEWNQELDEMSETEKRTAKGKSTFATFKQCARYLNPLFKFCRKKVLPDDIRQALMLVVNCCMERDYLAAMDHYIRMAIGNAPWPIGVTMVGIHERSAREKIYTNSVAHVMNDETTRKYLQSVKRLMTFCQRRYPTMPSKAVEFNPDHARNSLNNLGFRQPVYGDNRVNYQTRKRGINTLFNIMSRFGCQEETMSNIQHNERLEFLGDAVVEFLTSIHIYFMFPDLEEGGLATYRAALVQNQYLAILAKKLQLDRFMLYAHGSDLCHDLELRHAMANCFEALMAALFLDTGLEVADKVLANVLFDDNSDLLKKWVNYPKHPLQIQNPEGDRDLIEKVPLLSKLVEFEVMTGIEFKHVRLLARAFTHRSIGFNNLTLGTNQRMEFLGDTVLQLIASEYLYKHFPGHHEGHLSLLRSSLVNNRTQTVVCNDLGMADYLNHRTKGPLRTKDRADLLEAFIGALYVDSGLDKCRAFCSVCFFPRLEDFIIHQSWNDPKSKLQQCCLTLRSLESREPDIPIYKVIETIGPTNTRVYNVVVYFKERRLATGQGPSIQEAEMNAATNALKQYQNEFPELGNRRKFNNSSRYESAGVSMQSEMPSTYSPSHTHPPPAPARHHMTPQSSTYPPSPLSPPHRPHSPPSMYHMHYDSHHGHPHWNPVNQTSHRVPPYYPRYRQQTHGDFDYYYNGQMMHPPPPNKRYRHGD